MILNSFIFIFALLFIIVFTNEIVRVEEGSSCVIESTKTPGTCLQLKNCASAKRLVNQNKNPQLCGFIGTTPIVCCRPGEKSFNKCREYDQNLEKIIQTRKNSAKAEDFLDCATSYLPGYMNQLLDVQHFSFLALVGFGDNNLKIWKCSGALISENFILTTAHCVYSKNHGLATWTRLGAIKYSSPVDILVKEIIKHPNFTSSSFYNDIALLKINRPVQFSIDIRPTCLSIDFIIHANRFTTPGYNLLDNSRSNLAEELQRFHVEKVNYEECSESFKNYKELSLQKGIIDDSQICVKHTNISNKCKVELGAPLVIFGQYSPCSSYSLIGLNSFGKSCYKDVLSVYTRISHFVPWIEKNIFPDN